MRTFFKRIKAWVKDFTYSITPGKVAIKGASKAIGTTTLIVWLICSSAFFIFSPKTWFGVVPVVLIPTLAFLLGGLTIWLIKLIARIPKALLWVLPAAYLLNSLVFDRASLGWQFPLMVVVFAGGLGAALFTLLKSNRNETTLRQKVVAILGMVIGLSGLVWGLIWAFDTGFEKDPMPINASAKATFKPAMLNLPDPSEAGPYEVEYMTYGSGKDKHRPEYGDDVSMITDSVDGSRLLDNWKGLPGKLRTWYWDIEDKSLPINGRVWYPKGDGPFPLALIVHGNHSMFDYSDEGYGYLGELLASHGIIMVSVDENFINSGWTDAFGDGLDEENDARGWLLLKHLQNWRKWNKTDNNPFFEKVDMENLAVMGHSRGGEAAAVAGFFNQLEYYPDNAKEEFDFDFNIKAVVSIAPVDGQYKPANIPTPLKDVNYLVLHGANDGDVQSFAGLRQYERLSFSDSSDYFKSAIYVYGANHGQFNTSWGNTDSPFPWASLLNRDALIPMDDQLKVGKVFINAFLLTTLKGERGYQELFKDYRKGNEWLPNTIFLNQYEASDWTTIADFDQELDLTSEGQNIAITTENLTVWREQLVNMKWGNKGTRGVFIGWDSTAYNSDTAQYILRFNAPLDLKESPILSFEAAHSKENTYPDKKLDEEAREKEENETESDEEEKEEVEENNEDEENEKDEKEDDEKKKAPEPINFSLKLMDESENILHFNLNDYALLQPQLEVDIYKNKSLQTNKASEAVYQTFAFDLERLKSRNPDFNIEKVKELHFVFDQSKKGVIILDKFAIHKN